ncbi:MAG: transcriptional repressor, partial [Hyphomonadaceae bacterium]|nr:transcriptional repressor [Hyphomonadaceae bacterium]
MSELQEDGAELPPFLPMETLLHLAERSADQAGITLTRIRRHVYRMLLDADEPLGAYEIVDRLEGVGSAKPATAYRALSCLEVLGLVRKIKSLSKY